MMKSKQKRKHDIVHRPIVIPKATMDMLLELPVKVRSDSIALYIFYYYTSIWQKSNQCYATTNYIKGGDGLERKGLGLSKSRIFATKKALRSIPLIEDIQTRKKGKRSSFGKTYIKVIFYHSNEAYSLAEEQSRGVSNPSYHESQLARIADTNAYSSNRRNAYSNNNTLLSEKNHPSLEDVRRHITLKKIDNVNAVEFYKWYKRNDFKDINGKPLTTKNYKAKINTWASKNNSQYVKQGNINPQRKRRLSEPQESKYGKRTQA